MKFNREKKKKKDADLREPTRSQTSVKVFDPSRIFFQGFFFFFLQTSDVEMCAPFCLLFLSRSRCVKKKDPKNLLELDSVVPGCDHGAGFGFL